MRLTVVVYNVSKKLFLDWELLIDIKWDKRMRKDGLDTEPRSRKRQTGAMCESSHCILLL